MSGCLDVCEKYQPLLSDYNVKMNLSINHRLGRKVGYDQTFHMDRGSKVPRDQTWSEEPLMQV